METVNEHFCSNNRSVRLLCYIFGQIQYLTVKCKPSVYAAFSQKNIKENYKMPYPRYGGGPPQDNRNQGQNVSLPTNLF